MQLCTTTQGIGATLAPSQSQVLPTLTTLGTLEHNHSSISTANGQPAERSTRHRHACQNGADTVNMHATTNKSLNSLHLQPMESSKKRLVIVLSGLALAAVLLLLHDNYTRMKLLPIRHHLSTSPVTAANATLGVRSLATELWFFTHEESG